MYDNQIEKIESRTFSNLKNLRILDLNRNRLRALGSTTFNHLRDLNGLGLESNQLMFMRQITMNLKQLQNLTTICLGDNPVSKLPHDTINQICNGRNNCMVKIESTCLRIIIEVDHSNYIYSNIFSNLRVAYNHFDDRPEQIIG